MRESFHCTSFHHADGSVLGFTERQRKSLYAKMSARPLHHPDVPIRLSAHTHSFSFLLPLLTCGDNFEVSFSKYCVLSPLKSLISLVSQFNYLVESDMKDFTRDFAVTAKSTTTKKASRKARAPAAARKEVWKLYYNEHSHIRFFVHSTCTFLRRSVLAKDKCSCFQVAQPTEPSRELSEKEKEELVRQSDLDLAMDLFGDSKG